jgi:LysM domain
VRDRVRRTTVLAIVAGAGLVTCSPGLAEEADCRDGKVQVRPDDTLSLIAGRCDVSEGAILAANPAIDGSADLEVGATLRLQPPASQSQRLGDRLNHFAREADDALGRVAGQVGSSAQDLLNKNPDLKGRLERLGRRIGLGDGGSAPSLTLTPDQGPPGSTVTLAATGLPKERPFMIGVGAPNKAYRVLHESRSSDQGTLDAQVRVPERDEGKRVVFTLRGGDAVKLTSEPFQIVP